MIGIAVIDPPWTPPLYAPSSSRIPTAGCMLKVNGKVRATLIVTVMPGMAPMDGADDDSAEQGEDRLRREHDVEGSLKMVHTMIAYPSQRSNTPSGMNTLATKRKKRKSARRQAHGESEHYGRARSPPRIMNRPSASIEVSTMPSRSSPA